MIISEENKQRVCSECNNTNLYLDPANRELVCERCGTVISGKQLSRRPEWRTFDLIQRQKLPRTGSPINLSIHDKGLSTTIGWKNVDYAGRRLRSEARDKLYRLRKWNRWSKITSSRSRNLSHALSVMGKLSNELNLPRNVLETASMIYRKALKNNMIQGRSIVGVVVAALYMACRMCGVLRSLTDVAETANISRKIAARNYRLLHLKLGLDVPIVKRTGYINRLVSRLRLPGYIEMLSLRLMEEASKNNLTLGRSPAGLAAACIYISGCIMGERLTQHQVALEAQVTEVTIRNRYKELLRNIDIEIQI